MGGPPVITGGPPKVLFFDFLAGWASALSLFLNYLCLHI